MKNQLKTTLLLPWHWFPGFYYQHTPSSFMKATFEEIWEKNTMRWILPVWINSEKQAM